MPMTVNGFGTHICGSRGDVGWGSYDAMEWIVAAYMPIIPIKCLHTFDWRGEQFRMIPIRWNLELVARAFFGRWMWGLGLLGVLFGVFFVIDLANDRDNWMLFLVLFLAMLGLAVVIGIVLRQTDQRTRDIRRVLGNWPLGTCDPANLLDDTLFDIAGDPRALYGTETFAEAVPKCLQKGEYNRAMWAARVSTGLENRQEGEQLTDEVLRHEGVVAALESIKNDINTWQQVMMSEEERRAASQQQAAAEEEPLDALPVEDDRIYRRDEEDRFKK